MDTKYLNYILTIAKKKNMTKAAEELYVSQSSLSQYLTKLESEIGTPLFFRAKGELVLTPAGELYIKAADHVLQVQKQLYKDISNLDNKGHITVGVTSQFGLRVLSEIIPKFKAHYPDFTIEISETNLPALTRLLMEENIDIGILAANYLTPFGEQATILKNEEVYFAIPVNHPYCSLNSSSPIPVSELTAIFRQDNFLLSKKGSTLRTMADKIFQQYQYQPSAMCETNSIIATRSMVASGVGVTFIAQSCASDREHVAYYSLEPKLYRFNLLVRRNNWTLNQPEELFCRYIEESFL